MHDVDPELSDEQRQRRLAMLESSYRMSGALSEQHALHTLTAAADGAAPWALVSILAIATASPWSGSRMVRDRPRVDGGDAVELLAFLTLLPPTKRSLPLDSGWLAWLRHWRLAVPVQSVPAGPGWLRSDALADAWLCTPPRSAVTPAERGSDCLRHDGRLVALAGIAAALEHPGDYRTEITTLCEYLVGGAAAWWPTEAGSQTGAMTVGSPFRAWFQSYMHQTTAETVVAAILEGVGLTDFRPPAPSAEDAELARRLAASQAEANRLADLHRRGVPVS